MKKPGGYRAISGVTLFGLKRSTRAAACSAVDSPPHALLNDNGAAIERLERTGRCCPTDDQDNNRKGNNNVDNFSHLCRQSLEI
jgi:hypothetical protein